jgi:uncharacterized protein YqgV (UPF0045/DUF77 family)
MMRVSAQISLYPLRQQSLSPVIDEAVQEFRRPDLDVQPGPMSTRVSGEEAEVFDAMRQAFLKSAARGDVVMVATVSQACPASEEECPA